jgi:hypothetical protein
LRIFLPNYGPRSKEKAPYDRQSVPSAGKVIGPIGRPTYVLTAKERLIGDLLNSLSKLKDGSGFIGLLFNEKGDLWLR